MYRTSIISGNVPNNTQRHKLACPNTLIPEPETQDTNSSDTAIINNVHPNPLTWHESRAIDGGQGSAAILDVTGVRVTGHDGDLVQLLGVLGAQCPPTVGHQPAGRAVVRLLAAPPAEHQPLCRGHHAMPSPPFTRPGLDRETRASGNG